MGRGIYLLLTCMVFTIGRAQAPLEVKNIDLPDMYRQIDEAISQSPRYIADYEEKISKAKMCLVGGMLIVGYGYRLTKVTTSK